MIDYLESLKPYCKTARQFEILQAVINSNGHMHNASESLNINKGGAGKTIARIKRQAAKQGYAPEADLTHPVADTQILKGVSTLYDADNNVKMQWVKSNAAAESIAETLQVIADELNETITPVKPTTIPPNIGNDLLNLHILTDYHLGMFAWEELGGTDWDTTKAEQFLLTWFKYSLDQAPQAEVGVLLNLGDFFHSDSVDPVTPASKHLLDVDSAFAEIVRVGTRVLKKIITMMKQKYKTVVFYNVAGNHDTTSSIWLKEFFSSYYELDDSVIVDNSPDLYHAYKHGNISLFFHHGHKRSPKNIQETLVARFRDIYGSTTKSYTHLGHYHHSEVKESASMTVEQHRTMAAKDSYSSNGGYIAERSAYTITYHKTHGEVNRINVSAELIESII